MSKHTQKTIILAGGGSGGPIVPLVAIAEAWNKTDPTIKPVIVDVRHSVGSILARNNNIAFRAISAGKFRRYWSWRNFVSPLQTVLGFIQSLFLLHSLQPSLVIGAGGFVQVPVMWAAFVLRIPRAIHQQDVSVTLSNKLVESIASIITTTFEHSTKDFLQGSGLGREYLKKNKVYWTGNPIRAALSHLPTKEAARTFFDLRSDLPVLFVIGGGTGSAAINKFIIDNRRELGSIVQIIHNTGPSKQTITETKNYQPYAFIDKIEYAYAAADIVLGRAGIGTLTELAELQKPSIIVPLPDTHQEWNAELLYQHQAAVVLDQQELEINTFIAHLRTILFDLTLQQTMGRNLAQLFPNSATEKIITLLKPLVL